MGPSNSINSNIPHFNNPVLPRDNSSLSNSTDSKTNQTANHTIQQSNNNYSSRKSISGVQSNLFSSSNGNKKRDVRTDLNNNNNIFTRQDDPIKRKKIHPQAEFFKETNRNTDFLSTINFCEKTIQSGKSKDSSKRKNNRDLDNNNYEINKKRTSSRKGKEAHDLSKTKRKFTRVRDPYHYWTKEEEEKLKRAVREFGVDWALIAQTVFPDSFNNIQCFHKYKTIKDGLKEGSWSEEEVNLLEKGHALIGNQWQSIADNFLEGTRTNTACRIKMNTLYPNLKEGPWSEEETNHLIALYEEFQFDPQRWSLISSEIGNRTRFQCLQRYTSIVSSNAIWTEEEIFNLVKGYIRFQNFRDKWVKTRNKYFIERSHFELAHKYTSLKKAGIWDILVKNCLNSASHTDVDSDNNNHFFHLERNHEEEKSEESKNQTTIQFQQSSTITKANEMSRQTIPLIGKRKRAIAIKTMPDENGEDSNFPAEINSEKENHDNLLPEDQIDQEISVIHKRKRPIAIKTIAFHDDELPIKKRLKISFNPFPIKRRYQLEFKKINLV